MERKKLYNIIINISFDVFLGLLTSSKITKPKKPKKDDTIEN
jgi:hypothetical protein